MIGTTVSHYEIVEELESSSEFVVYRAVDKSSGTAVAIKFLTELCSGGPDLMERLRSEVRAASAVESPYVCKVFDIFEKAGRVYIATECPGEGEFLNKKLSRGGLEVGEVLTLAIQLGEALDVAHSRGVIRSDLRPANIFVTTGGDARVLGIGLTGVTAGDCGSAAPSKSLVPINRLTPEELLGQEEDPRTDLFSLGMTLYEMATGTPPFRGATGAALRDQVLHGEPSPPRKANPRVSRKLEQVILALLQRDPRRRPQSAKQLLADLRRIKWGVDSDSYISRQARSLTRAGKETDEPVDARAEADTVETGEQRISPVLVPALILVVGIPLLLAAAFWLTAPKQSHFPGIVIGQLGTGSEAVDSQMLEFLLQRALSQFPQVQVLTPGEFESALSRQADVGTGPTPLLPAIRLSGDISMSAAGVVVDLQVENRGVVSRETVQLGGSDQLLGSSLDLLTRRLLQAFDEKYQKEPFASTYRPVSELLTSDWDALRYFWEGEKAWSRLNLEDAERWFLSAYEVDPVFSLAHLKLAEVKMYRRQFALAATEVASAEERPGGLTQLDRLRVQAIKARIAGKPLEERLHLRQLVELRPLKKEYLYDLAESHFHTADVEDAIESYRDVLRLDPNFALAYNHLGYCYSWKGSHTEGIAALKRYLEIDGSANAYDSLGDAYLHSGDYASAIEMKRKAIELNPNQYHTKRGIGFLLMLQGEYQEAERVLTDYLREAQTDAERASHYAALAFLFYVQGRPDSTREMCRKGLDRAVTAPYDEEMYWLHGLASLQEGDLAEARRQAARMKNIIDQGEIGVRNYRPILKHWLHLRAAVEAGEGRREESLATLRQLRQIRAKLGYWATAFDLAYFLHACGQVYETLGDVDRAEEVYRESIAYNPGFARAHFSLGLLLRRKAQPEAAAAELHRFLELWRNADRTIHEVQLSVRILQDIL